MQFPDSVYKPHLIPSSSPTALISIVGDPVPAAAIQLLISKVCHKAQWTWEALPHGDNAFLLGFPSAEDLHRVDGI